MLNCHAEINSDGKKQGILTAVTKKNIHIDPRWLFASISLLISIFIYSQSIITNTDGVLYLRVADTFLSDGFNAAKNLYSNPYYSVLVALIAKLTGLTTFISAQALNTLTCAAIAWFMVDIARLTSQSSYNPWIAGSLFILYPQFNEYRDFIVRDFLFWALVLAFMSCYIRFLLSLNSKFLIAGLFLLSVGAMFRTEAILFALLPVICLMPLRKHIMVVRTTISFYRWLLIIIVPVITVLYLVNSSIFDSATQYIDKLAMFGDSYSRLSTNFEDYLLMGYLTEYSGAAVLFSFLIILSLKVLTSFTAPFLLLAGLSLSSSQDSRFSRLRIIPLLMGFIFYFSVVYIFLLSTTIIQGRHVLLLSLLLIPIFSSWIENFGMALNSRKNGTRNLLLVTTLFTVYLFTDSFFTFGDAKKYRTDGVLWLQGSPPQCKLLSNNSRVNYFSQMDTQLIHLSEVGFRRSDLLSMAGNSDLVLLELDKRNDFHIRVTDILDISWTRVASFGARNKHTIIWSNPELSPSCNIEAPQ
ncbi:MAG: hypothetical protein ACJAQS_000368 [Porticoccus sp.]